MTGLIFSSASERIKHDIIVVNFRPSETIGKMLFASFLGCYFLVGILFSIPFLFVGYKAILPEATGSGIRVRLLWVPAAIAIWPLLAFRWITERKTA